MDDKVQRDQEKRQARRKRRIRNQLIAYVVMILMILAVAAGVVFGIRFVKEYAQRQEAQDNHENGNIQQGNQSMNEGESLNQDENVNQDAIEQILASEEDIVKPPEPTPEITEPTPEQILDQEINARIEVMSLEDKVAGLFFVTPEAITKVGNAVKAGEGTREALAQYAVGGLIYFGNNIQSEEQLREMLENTAQYAKYPLFLGVDEEGGSVARIASAGIGTKVDGAGVIGTTGDPTNAYQAGVTIGSTLAGIGFNLDFAPVADLANVEGSIMAGRSYGAEASAAADYVTSMMAGLEEQKVLSCLKHFPGIGSSTEDTHNGRATTDRTLEQFQAEEFAVFRAGIEAGADMIMVSHMEAPGLTDNMEPCVFSRRLVTEILREEMGFEGIIITDALNMKAISDFYGADEAAVMAILAGCDMLLMPEDFEKAYNGVLQAIAEGHISEERVDDALRRIYRVKYGSKLS